MATTKPIFNHMLTEIKNNIKAQHEANNYINVPQQLRYETERFKRSLKNAVPEGQESILVENTDNNPEAFYLGMEKLYDLTVITNPDLYELYRHVTTTYLNQYQTELLQKIIFSALVILLFPRVRKARINDAKALIVNFLESIDVRKYDIE